MVGLQSLDLPIGVRIPVSQPTFFMKSGMKPKFASVMPKPIKWALFIIPII